MHLINGCILFMDASYLRIKLVYGCILFMDASYLRIKLIYGCILFMETTYLWMHLIYGCILFTNTTYLWMHLMVGYIMILFMDIYYLRIDLIKCWINWKKLSHFTFGWIITKIYKFYFILITKRNKRSMYASKNI